MVAPRTWAERERLARNLAEVIDELCRPYRERLLDLVQVQVERAFSLGQLCERQRNEEGHCETVAARNGDDRAAP